MRDNGACVSGAGGVQVDAKLVKQLRDSSGAGMMDCKKALANNDNNLEKATEFLRKKGLASADKKAGRMASEGAIASYVHAGSKYAFIFAHLCCQVLCSLHLCACFKHAFVEVYVMIPCELLVITLTW